MVIGARTAGDLVHRNFTPPGSPSLWAWFNSVALPMDFQIYKAIDASGPHFLHGIFRFCADDLVAIVVVLVALLFLIPWRNRLLDRRRAAVAATAAAGLALLIAQPIADAVDRARPFVAHPSEAHLLIARSTDPSFPSDHATGAFAIAAAVWMYDRTAGTLFLVLAVVLGFARVYVGTHYPGDVVGGAILGCLVALALRWGPVRGVLERIADACSQLWDRILATVVRRPSTSRDT
jgi:undecaprenyl-diphosphatase